MREEGELPEGWRFARVRDVAEVQLGKMLDKAKQRTGLRLPYLRNANVRWGAFDLSDLLEMPFSKEEIERFRLEPDDLVVCEGGEPGRAAVWREARSEIKFQKAVLRIRPGDELLPEWLALALRRDALSGDLEAHFTGSTIKHFTRQAILEYGFPLPPPEEQRRLVGRVEGALAIVADAQRRLASAHASLNSLRQAVLAAACDGRLLRSRSDLALNDALPTPLRCPAEDSQIDVPSGWTALTCAEVIDPNRVITYGVIKLGPPVLGGVPVLRSSDVRLLRIDGEKVKSIAPAIAAGYARTFLKGGEVVVTVRGSLGGVAVVPDSMAGYNVSREVAVIPVSPDFDSSFIALAIAAGGSQKWLSEVEKGVAYTGINIEDLKKLPLPIPPRSEQREIVRRVDALFSLADAIEKRVAAASARADKLTQAILAKAFRGELVPTEAELNRRRQASGAAAAASSATAPKAPRRAR